MPLRKTPDLTKLSFLQQLLVNVFLIINQQAHSAALEQHTPCLHVLALELDLYRDMYSMEPIKNLSRIIFVVPRNIFCVLSL